LPLERHGLRRIGHLDRGHAISAPASGDAEIVEIEQAWIDVEQFHHPPVDARIGLEQAILADSMT